MKKNDGDAYYRQSGNREIAQLQSPSKGSRLMPLAETALAVVCHQAAGTKPSTVDVW